jgi:DNA-binding NarL/FixJ family response regulator
MDLTPTELRVLLAIVESGGVPQVAAALGIANSTVRTHLGRLFSKTGTSRQADCQACCIIFESARRLILARSQVCFWQKRTSEGEWVDVRSW